METGCETFKYIGLTTETSLKVLPPGFCSKEMKTRCNDRKCCMYELSISESETKERPAFASNFHKEGIKARFCSHQLRIMSHSE